MNCEQRRQERGSAVAGAGSGRGQSMQQCCTNNWKLFCILLGLFYFLFLYFLSTGRLEDGLCMVPCVCCVLGGLQFLGLLSAP